jgi:arsenate reductase
MYSALQATIDVALRDLDAIAPSRKELLEQVALFISSRRTNGQEARLTFICTHNSRRSQMGQLWAAAAATHFGIGGVRTYSGGTKVTAFNPLAVASMRRAGFIIDEPGGENPRYTVTYANDAPALVCFSKVYDDPYNPSEGFAALMTCSEADEACPVVVGAATRIALRYDDPKVADGGPEEAATYDVRSMQFATEMLYAFSRVR